MIIWNRRPASTTLADKLAAITAANARVNAERLASVRAGHGATGNVVRSSS